MSRTALCSLVGLAACLSSSPAAAFCRTSTCDLSNPAENCQIVGGCVVSGLPLYWPSLCVSFGVQEDGSRLRGITYEQTRKVVVDAFLQWQNAPCPEGGAPSIQIADFGRIACNEPEYNQTAPNANVVMYRDKWPYTEEDLLPGDTLALTTVTFNVETGEIYDADVEINSGDEDSFAIGSIGPHDIDLSSVVTHELGHFLGLSHSNVVGATMMPSLSQGQTSLATIEADDIAGVCAIYPPDRTTTSESCVPRHGFSPECADQDTGCCTIAPGARAPRSENWALLLSALGLVLFAARRRG
jgi:hypothetical protein